MKKTAAVVVTYNRKDLLQQNIRALFAQTDPDFTVLVIDNASNDGTGEWLMEEYADTPRLKYYNTGKNLGGAGGFQYGIRRAMDEGFEYLWLMDDDTIPEPDAYEKLLECDEALGGNYGFLSGTALWKDGSPCKMNKQKAIRDWYEDSAYLRYGLLRCYHATFVSFFLPAQIVRQIGLPVKEFFIWGDDVEYSNRIAKRFPCYVAGASRVLHSTADNCGSDLSRDAESRIDRYRYAYRNEAFIARQNGLKGRLRQFAKVNLHILRVLRYSKTKKCKRIGIIVGSSLRGIFFRPKIEFYSE